MVMLTLNKQMFGPIAVTCMAAVVVCKSLVDHCYSRGCACALFLDFVVKYCKPYHMKMQNIRPKIVDKTFSSNVIPREDCYMIMFIVCRVLLPFV